MRHLASGGMAEVILARATGIEGFERHVVIKRIRSEQARDARFVQMFLDEARLAASLHHNNIAQVHDIGQDDGEYFFTMEYVHGEDLRRLLMHVADHDGKVPIEHVITIVASSAAALHHAHEHRGPDRKRLGIVHRDVSPANILVAYDGNVKVVDFGIAKVSQRTTETHSGLMKGKVAYMSPEQCVGQTVDCRSDIFCLGIVLYELVTVRRLFKGANDFLTMSSITHGVIPAPSELRPDLPPELEAIILKALAMNPADRYQTADEMRVALEEFAARAQLRSSVTALADYMRGQFGERPVPWLAADDDEDGMELTYDFDGSASGIVEAPPGFELPGSFVQQDSPLGRARTKAITDAPPLTDQSGGLPLNAVMPRAALSTTPSPITPDRPSRLWYLAGAGIGAVLGITIIAIIVVTGGDPAPAPLQPAAAAPAAPHTVAREPDPAPVTPPNLVAAPEPASAATVVKPKPAKIVVKKPAVKKPPPRGNWDPNALFPKKK
ncbi:MAG: serine/threonine-protein kinase [Kofleriaceae bacterium]